MKKTFRPLLSRKFSAHLWKRTSHSKLNFHDFSSQPKLCKRLRTWEWLGTTKCFFGTTLGWMTSAWITNECFSSTFLAPWKHRDKSYLLGMHTNGLANTGLQRMCQMNFPLFLFSLVHRVHYKEHCLCVAHWFWCFVYSVMSQKKPIARKLYFYWHLSSTRGDTTSQRWVCICKQHTLTTFSSNRRHKIW